MHPLKTERLVLRNLTPDDFKIFKKLYTHPETVKFSTIFQPTQHQIVFTFETSLNSEFCWIIEVDGKSIGIIHLANILALYLAEIGYILSHKHWGQGYMTEAVRAVVDYAFNGFNFGRIRAVTMQKNLRSVSLLERCGFVREAAIFEADYDGIIADVYYYSIIKS
ncbi:MAG: GNAT family N-acetyltransferase [Defluviitaleaceae bacterium]|nr:GNAT family N-acetyltransferase [Defluviitaleaceae bacterium]